MFARHIKVGYGPSDVRKVLIRTDWLSDARVDAVVGVGGWIPIDLDNDDAVYCLWLFPDKKGWSEWVIYFRLSGPHELTGRSEDYGKDGREFLKGNDNLPGNPKLMEFACVVQAVLKSSDLMPRAPVKEMEDNDERSPTADERQACCAGSTALTAAPISSGGPGSRERLEKATRHSAMAAS